MIQSMTGYGKAECIHGQNKIVVEIRSVNGKGSDINLKTQIIPRDKELEAKQMASKILQRGSIDIYANIEFAHDCGTRSINKDIFLSYYNQIKLIAKELPGMSDDSTILSTILRLPDVIEIQKREPEEDIWPSIKKCLTDALESISDFRNEEGKKLEEEIKSRVRFITEHLTEVEKYELERITTIKQKLFSKLEESNIPVDQNRFEQEVIYYLEKLDVTEEKVRLKQHCKYFNETIDNEEFPGKKLGFIAQEMGREINTLGSKANHAEIQKWVVRMKDELEKIKEQTLNIL